MFSKNFQDVLRFPRDASKMGLGKISAFTKYMFNRKTTPIEFLHTTFNCRLFNKNS